MRRSRVLRLVVGVVVTLVILVGLTATPAAQNPSTQISIAINNLVTGVTTFVRLRMNPGAYMNWGSGTDSAGYGFRDNAGTIQWKNSGGDWANLGTGGSGGAPADASYWVRVATGGLSNETAMGALGTGLVKNTTTTGVPSIAVAADIISLWTGTCNGTTVLAGNGSCIGTSGGAPSTSTYITQTPDAGLSAEQALSLLSTGLMKVTTTTGVVSTATVNDILGYFTGTCNSSTILTGAGTCVSSSGAPTDATYITQTPNGSLSGEQALSALATGLLKSTTGTGVVTIAVSADVISLFTGTCNSGTVLSGAGTCVAQTGGGAPTSASYWVRTADATLSNETVMGVLATGLVKNNTTSGIPSIATITDILTLFTGTCNSSTVLSGAGTCVSPTSGAPATETYITQTPSSFLSAEQALSTLATGLLKNTTGTGVLAAASVTDIISYWSGTCNSSTVLAGNGTCVAQTSGGAPTNATYIVQTPNGTLTNEQALSLLATGLVKNTTTTGVLSAAAVGDILGYFTGTCNVNTVLTGGGTCAALSTGFDIVSSGTNTQATMIVSTGATLGPAGSGTITANVLSSGITVPSPVVTGLLDLVSTGVRFTAADGVLTLLGLGNGNDENLIFDFDNGTANQVDISSGTGVTQVNWTATLKAAGYKSSDGTAGATTTCTIASITSITVKNGLITGCS